MGNASLAFSLGMALACWIIFAYFCRLGFRHLRAGIEEGKVTGLSNEYHNLMLRLSILAIFFFSLNVYLLPLRYWLMRIPGTDSFLALQGVIALSIFIFYLCTIWYFAYPIYLAVFQVRLERYPFISSNIKLNLPVIFPWLTLTFAFDLIAFSPWPGIKTFLEKPAGQMIYIASFLCIMMIFLPALIQRWWDCTPIRKSDQIDALRKFLSDLGVKYRNILNWPIFEGRMMTAGVMGIVPRFRYILITDSLLKLLSLEELKAVIAHEVGHIQYRHLLWYMLFILGYMVLSFGLYDLIFYIIVSSPYFFKGLSEEGGVGQEFYSFVFSAPILLMMFVYFRFALGFFMRNFERQADLYSAIAMGSPMPTVNALEKIALLSGKIRDLPSWHHFSIKERVDCLLQTLKDPGLIKRHNRFLILLTAIYVICVIGLGSYLYIGSYRDNLEDRLIQRMEQLFEESPEKMIEIYREQLDRDPDNISLLQALSGIYIALDREEDAIKVYEKLLDLKPDHALALNNLSWILITSSDQELRAPERGLKLAEKAVSLERVPEYLDTLAEALYVNGLQGQAISMIKEAISIDPENGYYQEQLKRFSQGMKINTVTP